MKLLHLSNGTRPYIFRDIKDDILSSADIGERLTAVGAYVLMPNHFHILIKETVEGGLTKFVEKLSTGYAMYFNKKHKRVGPLFQGRFKAEHVGRDEYLKYLFAYIHLNPVALIDPKWKHRGIRNKKETERFLAEYTFSSYPEYSGRDRSEFQVILDRKEFPEYFKDNKEFGDFISDWLEYAVEARPSPAV